MEYTYVPLIPVGMYMYFITYTYYKSHHPLPPQTRLSISSGL